ncbi:MAG: cytochrome c biogenesis protein ResB [Verrucomicrobiota bacterium]
MFANHLIRFFTSLRLTVALLVLGLVLVFWGTMAQVNLGLYQAQNEFFRSYFIYWTPKGSSLKLPIFPGGYLLGGLLLINLLAAHFRYYRATKKKLGIIMVHLGIVLLLAGQFLTDLLSTESTMHIRAGSSSNYSESTSRYELAVTDTTDAAADKVVTFPDDQLRAGHELRQPELPFSLGVNVYHPNSTLTDKPDTNLVPVKTTAGFGADFWWRGLPRETAMDRRDIPSGIVEVQTPQGTRGTFLVSGYLGQPQRFAFNQRNYQIALRLRRYYKPFSLHLVEFKFDRYPGTEIPKNFSSRVRLQRTDTGEDRELLIYMNNPLRYGGETFYQADWDHEDEKGTILQVVRNPGWLTPYFACGLVGLGLVVQFMTHLAGFVSKRKTV